MIAPITLVFAAALALLNIWLGVRIGRLRVSQKVSHGDGGVPELQRRMRAQLNFIEYSLFVLILFALIEMTWGQSLWLWLVALVYLVGRVLHAFGMDKEGTNAPRAIGILVTYLVTLGLAIAALYAGYTAAAATA